MFVLAYGRNTYSKKLDDFCAHPKGWYFHSRQSSSVIKESGHISNISKWLSLAQKVRLQCGLPLFYPIQTGGQFNKTFRSVIYKCSHCFRVWKQWLHLINYTVKVLFNWPRDFFFVSCDQGWSFRGPVYDIKTAHDTASKIAQNNVIIIPKI